MPRHTSLSGAVIVSVLAAGVAVLAIACSGAEPQDVLSGTSASSSSGASSSGTSGGTSSGTSSGTSGASGTSGTPAGCPPEEEPNDSRDEANTLAPTLCGTLSGDDGKDFLTFQLKPTTKSMSINFTGRIRLKVDVKGRDTVELTPENAGVVPFVMGQAYLIEVTPLTDSSTSIPWRVTVVEK